MDAGTSNCIIYDLTSRKSYDSSYSSEEDIAETDKQIYSYAYTFVNTDYQIVPGNLVFAENLYKLEYTFIDSDDNYQVSAIVSADYKVQQIIVKKSLKNMDKIEYAYINVLPIDWPK